jgi:MoxR-like ATPase
VVGKREALELVLLGFLADGHVLIEDFPGLAKTLIARSFAQAFDMRFARIQFTPDLMPSDVTGSSIFNQRSGDFEFRPGPIFTNLLLGDEINRAPPKTQAALLEAMQERQVTIEGQTNELERPFLVIATQNPITRARTRSPRRSSIASCSGCASAIPRARTNGRCSSSGSTAPRTRSG